MGRDLRKVRSPEYIMRSELALNSRSDVRDRIVNLARERFLSVGFVRVNMQDLAYSLGMSKKTLYRYFPSKVSLLREVSRAVSLDIHQGVDNILANKRVHFLEKLHRLMAFLASELSKVGRPLLQDVQRYAPKVWQEIDEWRHKRIQVNFSRLVAEGRRKGFFRSEIDSQLLVVIYITLIEGIINPEILSQLPLSASQAFDTVIKVFFEGVLTDRARAAYRSRRITQGKST